MYLCCLAISFVIYKYSKAVSGCVCQCSCSSCFSIIRSCLVRKYHHQIAQPNHCRALSQLMLQSGEPPDACCIYRAVIKFDARHRVVSQLHSWMLQSIDPAWCMFQNGEPAWCMPQSQLDTCYWMVSSMMHMHAAKCVVHFAASSSLLWSFAACTEQFAFWTMRDVYAAWIM